MKKIILICGKRRSGKDFTADIISDISNIQRFSIAYNLKSIIAKIAEISVDELEELKNDEKSFIINYEKLKSNIIGELLKMSALKYNNRSVSITDEMLSDYISSEVRIISKMGNIVEIDARRALQYIGNLFKIIFNDYNIWISLLNRDIVKTDNILITDFRFKAEYDYLKKYDYDIKTIRIIGPTKDDDDKYDKHTSEIDLNDFKTDFEIDNSSRDKDSYLNLHNQVLKIIKEINV